VCHVYHGSVQTLTLKLFLQTNYVSRMFIQNFISIEKKKPVSAYIVGRQEIFTILKGMVLAAILITMVDETGAKRRSRRKN
jgi:hypothetical protein